MRAILKNSLVILTAVAGLTFCGSAHAYKAPYADFGKPSKVNTLPRVKPVRGHFKSTSKGFKYVNPYYRSK